MKNDNTTIEKNDNMGKDKNNINFGVHFIIYIYKRCSSHLQNLGLISLSSNYKGRIHFYKIVLQNSFRKTLYKNSFKYAEFKTKKSCKERKIIYKSSLCKNGEFPVFASLIFFLTYTKIYDIMVKRRT